jgi:hypothetical protein
MRMALRFVDSRYAIARIATIPSSPENRVIGGLLGQIGYGEGPLSS